MGFCASHDSHYQLAFIVMSENYMKDFDVSSFKGQAWQFIQDMMLEFCDKLNFKTTERRRFIF